MPHSVHFEDVTAIRPKVIDDEKGILIETAESGTLEFAVRTARGRTMPASAALLSTGPARSATRARRKRKTRAL